MYSEWKEAEQGAPKSDEISKIEVTVKCTVTEQKVLKTNDLSITDRQMF